MNGDDVITPDEIPERLRLILAATGAKLPEKMNREEFTKYYEEMRSASRRGNPTRRSRSRGSREARTQFHEKYPSSPLSPVLRGEGPGVRGEPRGGVLILTPHPRPLSPEYRGEGR